MNQTDTTTRALEQETDAGENGLIEILIVLAKYKRRIILLPAAVAVLAAAVSFAIPQTYLASTKLLPPQQAQSGAAALLSQLGGMAGAAAGAAGIKSPNELYVGMLRSRTVADRLIEKFGLKKAYDTDSQELARKALESNTVITSGKDGLITIEVVDRDQKLVAPITNAYVSELINLTNVLALTEPAQRRVFFEKQLELAKNNLATAEMTLKRTLETRGVISVDSDSRAMVETVARLRAQASAKEIQLNSMQAFVTASHPDYRRVQEELASVRSELSKLENGRAQSGVSAAPETSQAGLENIKILRDVKYFQMLYELLAKQYEVARLDEAKNAAIIQVLDTAVEPERKFKPKRAIIVMISTLLALLAAIFWAFMAEARQRALLRPNGSARWVVLKSYLRRKTH